MNINIGDTIRIINMSGEEHYNGREGVVEYIDSISQLHGTWGGLAINLDVDKVEVIKRGE